MNRTLAATVLAAAAAASLSACSSDGWLGGDDSDDASQSPPTAPSDPSRGEGTPSPADPKEQKEAAKSRGDSLSLSGTLVGGVMGVGGEHTGWTLDRPDNRPDAEVDMRSIANASSFAGKRITITGRWVEKKYTERGTTRVFVADKVVERDAARY